MDFKTNCRLSFISTTEFCKTLELPRYNDQFGYPYVEGRRFKNGAISPTRQLPSLDSVDIIWRLELHNLKAKYIKNIKTSNI